MRLRIYPGALRTTDVTADKIDRILSVSPQVREFVFTPKPDLISSDRYQLGAETDEIILTTFVQSAIGGVVNAEYGVKTLFDSGGDTYFKLLVGDQFEVQIYGSGAITQDIPFTWTGRQTIGFLLYYDTAPRFNLLYDGVVYAYTQAGVGFEIAQTDLTLKAGRYERIDSFSTVSNGLTELEELIKGTSLNGEIAYDS